MKRVFTVIKKIFVSFRRTKAIRINTKHMWSLSCGESGQSWNSCVVISPRAAQCSRSWEAALAEFSGYSRIARAVLLMAYVTVTWRRRCIKSDKISNRHALLQVSRRSVCAELHEVEQAYCVTCLSCLVLHMGVLLFWAMCSCLLSSPSHLVIWLLVNLSHLCISLPSFVCSPI